MKPSAKCISGKKMYPNARIAEDALIEAWSNFDYSRSNGPVGIYLCDDCGHCHFTSKGAMNAHLEEQLANGQIKKQREANRWIDKLKHK